MSYPPFPLSCTDIDLPPPPPTQCDQREPNCGQCEKRLQRCPGYRNQVDLMFRDESSHVIKKARAKQRYKTSLSPDSDSSPDDALSPASATPTPEPPRAKTSMTLSVLAPSRRASAVPLPWVNDDGDDDGSDDDDDWDDDDDSLLPSPNAGSWPSTPMIAVMYSLAPTCQERGTAYFFSRYVTMDENACHQRFDFIYDVWKPASLSPDRQLDGVMASMTAVGLVGVANLTRSGAVMESARKSYGTALRLTNAALENPREAVKDTTMLSVLILGLFEMMTDPSAKSMKAWHEHVNGAAALAKMRGPAQFRTRPGVRMFTMLCQNVMITCIQKEVPMPPLLVGLRSELTAVFKEPGPGLEMSQPIYKVLQARYDIKTGAMSDPDVMLARLNEIEDDFERAIAAFPPEWQYRVFRLTKPHASVYRDVAHLYPSLCTATVWNGLRGVRLLILETIIDEMQKRFRGLDTALIPPRYADETVSARSKLERVMAAILASVPQHFGLLSPLGNDVDALMPISTTELREPLTPPAGSREPVSAPAPGEQPGPEEAVADDSGPTLADPTRASNADEEAERFMLLASATNTIVWPLYSVGMSSMCTPSMKAYVVDRLMAIFHETGLNQARAIAGIVRNREIASSPSAQPTRLASRTRSPSPDTKGAHRPARVGENAGISLSLFPFSLQMLTFVL